MENKTRSRVMLAITLFSAIVLSGTVFVCARRAVTAIEVDAMALALAAKPPSRVGGNRSCSRLGCPALSPARTNEYRQASKLGSQSQSQSQNQNQSEEQGAESVPACAGMTA